MKRLCSSVLLAPEDDKIVAEKYFEQSVFRFVVVGVVVATGEIWVHFYDPKTK